VDYARIAAFDRTAAVAGELKGIGAHSLFSLLGEVVLYDASFRQLTSWLLPQVAGLPPDFVSTDAQPYLEYQTPKGNSLPPALWLNPAKLRALSPVDGLPAELEIRGAPDAETRDYARGMALEDRHQFPQAISYFEKIQGTNRACAQGEIAWIEALLRKVHDRSLVLPAAPLQDCP
jgi:hypothetical protein